MTNPTLATKILLILFLNCLVAQAQFQYASEVLNLFPRSPVGSMRIQGIGGAGSSLGGDISSSVINPAGLGFFQKSVISLSPTLNFHSNEADFLGNSSSESKANVNLNQLGIVFHKPSQRAGLFKGGAFSITFNRLQDFHGRKVIEGVNDQDINSIIDYFLAQSQGYRLEFLEIDNDPIYSISRDFSLGYATFLINPFDPTNIDNDLYYSFVDVDPINKRKEITTSGALNEWSFAYGGNIDDTFYFGAKLGIQSLSYSEESIYEEAVLPFQGQVLNSITFNERTNLDGIGVNANIGVIWRIHDYVRWGASFTTPTAMRMSYDYSASLSVDYNDYVYNDFQFQEENFTPYIPGYINNGDTTNVFLSNISASMTEPWSNEFSVTSPMRFQTGLSVFFNKNGFISVDAEYVNYGNVKMGRHNSNLYDLDNYLPLENNETGIPRNYSLIEQEEAKAKALYRATWNFRAGAEYRINQYRIRAGVAYFGSPHQDQSTSSSIRRAELAPGFDYYFDTDRIETSRMYYSLGAGIRKSNFFIDVLLQQTRIKEQRALYPFSNENGRYEVATLTPAQFARSISSNFKLGVSFGIFF